MSYKMLYTFEAKHMEDNVHDHQSLLFIRPPYSTSPTRDTRIGKIIS